MYVGRMTLSEFMQAEGIDDTAVGKMLKPPRSRVSVSRYRRGLEDIPSEYIKQLVVIGKGKMTSDELLGIKVNEAAQ